MKRLLKILYWVVYRLARKLETAEMKLYFKAFEKRTARFTGVEVKDMTREEWLKHLASYQTQPSVIWQILMKNREVKK